ncbi:hypothetical protein WICPIJ_002487 [Wickerhamomyces pijperi]|uniref:Uncharacterized protein n=1 Tax=Wickerhamomyces pijperi TaxID=599730 RepID=A0A9P8TPL7_WICPI|nr:hypothetical protein WICPIJ_002487 [Wickerhamomyces pijperi]
MISGSLTMEPIIWVMESGYTFVSASTINTISYMSANKPVTFQILSRISYSNSVILSSKVTFYNWDTLLLFHWNGRVIVLVETRVNLGHVVSLATLRDSHVGVGLDLVLVNGEIVHHGQCNLRSGSLFPRTLDQPITEQDDELVGVWVVGGGEGIQSCSQPFFTFRVTRDQVDAVSQWEVEWHVGGLRETSGVGLCIGSGHGSLEGHSGHTFNAVIGNHFVFKLVLFQVGVVVSGTFQEVQSGDSSGDVWRIANWCLSAVVLGPIFSFVVSLGHFLSIDDISTLFWRDNPLEVARNDELGEHNRENEHQSDVKHNLGGNTTNSISVDLTHLDDLRQAFGGLSVRRSGQDPPIVVFRGGEVWRRGAVLVKQLTRHVPSQVFPVVRNGTVVSWLDQPLTVTVDVLEQERGVLTTCVDWRVQDVRATWNTSSFRVRRTSQVVGHTVDDQVTGADFVVSHSDSFTRTHGSCETESQIGNKGTKVQNDGQEANFLSPGKLSFLLLHPKEFQDFPWSPKGDHVTIHLPT